jgi:class 3 adenylate cyclase/pimeloyl-ACP methyl ester carboxylesterase
MDMQIRYATRADGAKTAYGVMGDGPPVVVPPPWVWNLEWWRIEPHRSFADRLAERFKLVLYDKHGCGLSERDRTDFTIEDDLLDMEAVVSATGLDQFSVFCWSGGALLSALYNSRHAGRVTRFAFFGVPRSPDALAPAEERAVLDAVTALARAHWGMGSKAFIEMMFGRDLNAEQVSQIDQAQRGAATGEMATNLFSAIPGEADQRSLFASVTQPALVMHRRGDQMAPFEGGRELAAFLSNARYVPLEGSNHIPTYGDAESVLVPLIEFLEEERHAPTVGDLRAGAPSTILFTDIEDSTPLTQRLGDERAQVLVREHNGIVRDALQVHAGTEIKHTGDGIMASFASPSRGIECAIAIQRAFGDRDGAERPGLRVRIGLNAGEPLVEEGDLYGTSVQLARRVCDSAEPGQIVVPEGVRHLVAGKGFLFADRGVVTLKGFEDPVRLYEVRWRE